MSKRRTTTTMPADKAEAAMRLYRAGYTDKAWDIVAKHEPATAVILRAMPECGDRSWLCDDPHSPIATARDWSEAGFGEDAPRWWRAGCFDPQRAKELLLADVGGPEGFVGIDPDTLARVPGPDGTSVGYAHANGDLSIEEVVASYRNYQGNERSES